VKRARAWACALGAGLVLGLVVACSNDVGEPLPACSDADSDPSQSVDWGTQIVPLLWTAQNGADKCTYCHLASFPEGSTPAYLYLESYTNLQKGSKNGPIVVPGKPCGSLLVKKLRGTATNGARMPRGGPFFTPEQIQLVADWIAEGAKGDDEWQSKQDGGADSGASPYPGY